MNSPHISIERALAFLLHHQELTPEEEEHLVGCDVCQRSIVEAASAELNISKKDSD